MVVESSEAGCFGFCLCTTLMGIVFLFISIWNPEEPAELGMCVVQAPGTTEDSVECTNDAGGGPPVAQFASGTIILDRGGNASCSSVEVHCIANVAKRMQDGEQHRCRRTAGKGCVTDAGVESMTMLFRSCGILLIAGGAFSLQSMTGGDCPLNLSSIHDSIRHVPRRVAHGIGLNIAWDTMTRESLVAREISITSITHPSDSDECSDE
jgi:hypothetical protein